MLSLVTGIPQNSFRSFSVGAPKSHRAVELERRRLHVSKYMKDLGLIAGVCPQKLNELKINLNFKFSIDADAKFPDEINLPMLYFFEFEKDFNVSVNDIINLDDQGIQDYYDKVLSVFNFKGNLLDEGSLQEFRREFAWIKNNPERAANALRFAILHEMGHLVDPKGGQIPLPSKKVEILVFLCSLIICGGIFLGLPIAIGVLLTETAFCLLYLSTIIVTMGVSITALKFTDKAHYNFHKRVEEVFADRFAAGALKGEEGDKIRDGGIYLFEHFHAVNPRIETSKFQRLLNKLNATHPSPLARIRMLQNYQPDEADRKLRGSLFF